MATVPSEANGEWVTNYCNGVDAGAGAVDGGEGVQKKFMKFAADNDAKRADKARAEQVLLRARKVLGVRDVGLDAHVTLVSGTAFLAAGKDEKKEPYYSNFGTVTAAEFAKFGPNRATSVGKDILKVAKAQQHPQLVPLIPDLEKHVDLVANAGQAVENAVRDLLPFEVAELAQETALQKLVDECEVELLRVTLGRPSAKETVRTVFAIPRKESKQKDDAPVPTP